MIRTAEQDARIRISDFFSFLGYGAISEAVKHPELYPRGYVQKLLRNATHMLELGHEQAALAMHYKDMAEFYEL